VAITDEALALIGAAFIAGVKAQAVKEAKSIGVDLVKEGAAQIRDPSRGRKAVKEGAVRAVSPYHKHLGRVMKRLKKSHTKKNGDWKKGWDMKRIMAAAHKETKRARGKK
jgi:hypothetical protein